MEDDMTTIVSDNGDRVTDGRIDDAEEFWQVVQDTGYLMEGESPQFEGQMLTGLKGAMDEWFANHSEITVHGPLEHFAMHAVHHLVNSLNEARHARPTA
jgi:hypothetical protein